ncbi:site-specific DNA-methyltransferase [Candidatus Kaiserbacteria bacterium]|nr:site-specific DNA-methyltransferase [Candidatus Kaiserbacteria bacterium]
MASLNFKGKSAVWNHHLSVPYHTLDLDVKKSRKGADSDENLIIHGDNLLALKALLPKYQGRIKCIYIDPPYNTGNENWVYNDKVNSPLIKEWLGKTVAKDDLTKHDKWLCMMTPRLKLLRDLLADDGVIFVSIDDNEQAHLKNLMDEIFDEGNFIGELIHQRAKGGGQAKQVVKGHDYICAYAKNIDSGIVLRRAKVIQQDVVEIDGKEYLRDDDVVRKQFGKYDKSLGDRRCFYEELEKYKGPTKKKEIDEKIKTGELVLEKHRNGMRLIVRYTLLDETSSKLYSIIKVLSEDGKDDLADLGIQGFNYPKPVELIRQLIQSVILNSNTKNEIILDSFAGSGTTAHAVINLNKEDGGNRKFILVEMEDYADKITAERVRRVIKKDKLKTGFSFYNLGPAIDAETILTGKLPTYEQFAKYVFYLATGKNLKDEKKIKEKEYFVGKDGNETIYLLYKQDPEALKTLAITLDWAQMAHGKHADKKIVYAPACYLDEESLDKFNIQFVSIPYNLFEKTT